MITKTLNRSGMLLILSGILLAIGMVFHPDIAKPGYALEPAWVPIHILLGLSALSGLAGLAGVYGAMNLKLTGTGRAAFGIAMFGLILLAGIMFFFEATVLPVLARYPAYQPLTMQGGPLMSGAPGIAIGISMLIVLLGLLFLAVYLAMTRTIRPLNAFLFIGVALLVLAPQSSVAFRIIGGLMLGAGITWLGISVRNGVAHRSLESMLKVQDECLAHLGHA